MIKLSEILFEETRYKKETGKSLPNWQDKLKQYEQSKEFFVHFSKIPRVALYLINKYDTPIGFYAYPLDFKKMQDFAVDRPYAIVFNLNPDANILYLNYYTKDNYNSDLAKLKNKYKISDEEIKDWEQDSRIQSPAGFIWNVTRHLSFEGILNIVTEGTAYDREAKAAKKTWKSFSPAKKQYKRGADILKSYQPVPIGQKGGGNTGKWSVILNKVLGYDGVIDDCNGIIHDNEPCQAVFFNTKTINVKEIIQITEKIKFTADISNENDSYINQDLSGKDFNSQKLTNKNFYNSNLQDANFDHANLNGSNFQKANMEKTNLAFATLNRAILKGANLRDAKLSFTTCTETNLSTADLNNSDLSSANLTRTNLSNTNLSNANLYDVMSDGANLSGANLSGAKLDYAKFYNANFSGANFSGAKLDYVKFYNVDLSGANLENVNLSETIFNKTEYDDSTKFPEGFDPNSKGMINLVKELSTD